MSSRRKHSETREFFVRNAFLFGFLGFAGFIAYLRKHTDLTNSITP